MAELVLPSISARRISSEEIERARPRQCLHRFWRFRGRWKGLFASGCDSEGVECDGHGGGAGGARRWASIGARCGAGSMSVAARIEEERGGMGMSAECAWSRGCSWRRIGEGGGPGKLADAEGGARRDGGGVRHCNSRHGHRPPVEDDHFAPRPLASFWNLFSSPWFKFFLSVICVFPELTNSN